MKLNQVLARTETESAQGKALVSDYAKYFAKNQGDFQGEKKTYEPVPGYLDNPANRYNKAVVTTVDEKIDYFREVMTPILKAQFDLEATNASGAPRAELIVGGNSWGEFSSLELLRLKSLVSNPKLTEMISNIPVRSDARDWEETDDPQYEGREFIFQSPKVAYEDKTTEKDEVILSDPNIERAIAAGKEINYTPQTTMKTKQVMIGAGTLTKYSGEWTHSNRAYALKRLAELRTAVIDALQRANDAEVVESTVDVNQLFDYIFG